MHPKLRTPVALLIYNRPDLTFRVFGAIAQVKPPKLLISADGPKTDQSQDAEKCALARSIVNRVDWDCDVLTHFSKENLGMKHAEAGAMDWIFSLEKEAIILEDDCLPNQSFFYFCQDLLEKYREDTRIACISGTNFQLGNSRSDGSYFFSRYVSFWGWASWRRTWNYYDIGMKTWPDFKRSGQLEMICDDECEFAYWNNIFDRTFSGEIKTWDYQMVYACWSQGCLNIQPNKNLISNIGFAHPDATNLRRKTSYADLPVLDIRELRHPPFVVRHRDADLFAFNEKYFGKQMRAQNSFPKKIYARLSKMKRKVLSIFNTLITKA